MEVNFKRLLACYKAERELTYMTTLRRNLESKDKETGVNDQGSSVEDDAEDGEESNKIHESTEHRSDGNNGKNRKKNFFFDFCLMGVTPAGVIEYFGSKSSKIEKVEEMFIGEREYKY